MIREVWVANFVLLLVAGLMIAAMLTLYTRVATQT